MTPVVVGAFVASIPPEWEVPSKACSALSELVVERARFVADTIEDALTPSCWPPVAQDLF